jgi:prepilin-type N-terminal cleavage/methylation domain-containing protein
VRSRDNKGFTLIEMMVVVSLIGILMAIAIPSILSQRPLWRVNGTAREMLTNMRMTQSKAIRSGYPHTITFLDTTNNYVIFADDGSGTGTIGDGLQNGTEPTIKTVSLGTSIKYGSIGGPPALLGGAINPDGINYPTRGTAKSVIFRPDGTAESGTVYFYSELNPTTYQWQRAVEVVGNTGRVKVFTYDPGTSKWH